ncbi:uncharacterized protein I303_106790 [Kwoniella dejecticola CBS 10117]|uniref:Chalcone isomerase domain-containing protein n=1 Tax=Kwoniella dejecticola CBS 10117 TaxID=1296121 RepID=A0A1A5ZTN9_9TREE|nr:uncharacterized protein I303_08568 [Kwoniella dejecticola CBS 10117]OBR81183.1 hypothetical protein I303_08568 [Kwoniella dejecticola CBS 10117]
MTFLPSAVRLGLPWIGGFLGYSLVKAQGLPTVHADSRRWHLRDDAKAFRVDPDTNIQFPLDLSPSLSTPSPGLSLVGLGVRKVSFLRVKVYSAGFYLDEAIMKDLHNVEGWHTFTAQHLLTPPTKPSDPLNAPQLSGEDLMRNLFDRPVAAAVRIVPNRNTDFGHLRDAFTRALQARQKLARSKGQLSNEDEQRITESIQTLKSFFPSQTVPKGKQVVLLRPREGGLVVEYEGKILGRLNDPWIGKQLMLTYFADKETVSEKLKEDVAKGLEEMIDRK